MLMITCIFDIIECLFLYIATFSVELSGHPSAHPKKKGTANKFDGSGESRGRLNVKIS